MLIVKVKWRMHCIPATVNILLAELILLMIRRWNDKFEYLDDFKIPEDILKEMHLIRQNDNISIKEWDEERLYAWFRIAWIVPT